MSSTFELTDEEREAFAAIATQNHGGGVEVGGDIRHTDEELAAFSEIKDLVGNLEPFSPNRPAAKRSLASQVNSKEGVPKWDAFKKSYKGTKVGELNYLRNEFGPGAVEPVYNKPRQIRDQRGGYQPDPDYKKEIINFAVRLPSGKVTLANPPGADWNDIAELGGPATEIAPGVAVGLATGGAGLLPALGAGALADLGGSVARQFVGSQVVPGEENMTAGDRITSAAINTAAAPAARLATKGAVAVGRRVFSPAHSALGWKAARAKVPTGSVVDADEEIVESALRIDGPPVTDPRTAATAAGNAAKAINQPATVRTAQEAARANAENLGPFRDLPFTPGQLGGGKEQLALEGLLRQKPGAMDAMGEGDLARLRFFDRAMDAQLNRIGPTVGAGEAVTRVGSVYGASVDRLLDIQEEITGPLYDVVDRASGAPSIRLRNTLAAIGSISEKFASAVGTDSADVARKSLMSRYTALVDRAGGNPDAVRVTARELGRDLSIYGKAARGSGSVIKDLDDRKANKAIAAQIFGALQKDLEEAAGEAQTRQANGRFMSRAEADSIQQAAMALREARDAWAWTSTIIETQKDKVLMRAAELVEAKTPEQLVQNIANATDRGGPVSARDIGRSVELMNQVDGGSEALAPLRRESIAKSLYDHARPRGVNPLAADGIQYEPALFARWYDDRRMVLRELFRGDPDGLRAIGQAANAARMLGAHAGIRPGGSQTALIGMFGRLFDAVSTVATDPGAAGREVILTLRARRLAKTFNDPEARNIFLGLADRPAKLKTEAGLAALARLKAILDRDEALGSAPEENQDQPQSAGYGNTIAPQ